MAQAGVYAPGAVIDADVSVTVNGVAREHVSMSWAGDTTGGLPEQVVSAGTGMRSRSGSIVWARQDLVQVDPPHPLRQAFGWPPREGDELVISASVDTGNGRVEFRRFTGRLGRTTGSLVDGSLTSEITDVLGDRLQAQVTIDPLGPESRPLNTRPSWAAWRAIEGAGMGLLPSPDDPSVVLHVGGQSSRVPAVGVLVGTGGTGYSDAPYSGYSDLAASPAPGSSTRSATLVMARGSRQRDSSVTATFAGGAKIKLALDKGTGVLSLSTQAAGVVWTGAWTGVEEHPILAFAVGAGWVFVRVGADFVPATTTAPGTGGALTEVRGGGVVTAIQARYCSSMQRAFAECGKTMLFPAVMDQSRLESMGAVATRGYQGVTSRKVVDEWSEATLASVWMDEHGRPFMVARDRLVDGPVVRTLRLDERLMSGSWSRGDDAIRSGVVVKGQEAALEASQYERVTLYQESSARTIDAPEVVERFVQVPDEEEWGPVDLVPSKFGIDAMLGNLPANGTWVAAVSSLSNSSEDPETWAHQNNITYTAQFERLGQRALKVTETVGNIPSGRTVYLKTPLEGTQIHPKFRGVASPTIRGAWKSTWADYSLTGATEGPSWAPPLELNVGWWLPPADAQAVADALAIEVTSPMVTLSRVEVLWDPRRQIGDVETWIATTQDGAESWRADVLITGYEESWDGSVPSQSVDVRIISITDPTSGKTYADLRAAYKNYGAMSGTYEQTFNALPGAL